MVLSLRTMNTETIESPAGLAADMGVIDVAYQTLSSVLMNPDDVKRELQNNHVLREMISGRHYSRGPFALKYLQPELDEIRSFFSFAMAPYYTPLTHMPHPRWAPHFCVMVTDQKDINATMKDRPKEYDKTKEWSSTAAGYRYMQGYHPPVQLERSDLAV